MNSHSRFDEKIIRELLKKPHSYNELFLQIKESKNKYTNYQNSITQQNKNFCRKRRIFVTDDLAEKISILYRSFSIFISRIVENLSYSGILYDWILNHSLRKLLNKGFIKYDSRSDIYSLSQETKKILGLTEKIPNEDNLDALFEWVLNIGDKQYHSYTWNDAKVQCLLNVNAALIAGVLFVLQLDDAMKLNQLSWNLFCSAFFFLLSSIIICLLHSIPRLNSKLGNDKNPRTIIGIGGYIKLGSFLNDNNISRNKYYEKLLSLDKAEMIRMSAWQIIGMAKNNETSYKMIFKGVLLTVFGLFFVAAGILSIIWEKL